MLEKSRLDLKYENCFISLSIDYFLHKMWCIMNKCQHQLVCYGLYPSSACFCYFLKQKEENQMSACMSFVGIIFRPRLTALFSSSYLFIVSLHSLQHIENCNALECFSKVGREKMAHGHKFSNTRVHRTQSRNG